MHVFLKAIKLQAIKPPLYPHVFHQHVTACDVTPHCALFRGTDFKLMSFHTCIHILLCATCYWVERGAECYVTMYHCCLHYVLC
jgi:hypothetical protein